MGEKNSLELGLTNYFRNPNWALKIYQSWVKWNKIRLLGKYILGKLDFDIDSVSNLTALPNANEMSGGMARTWLGFYKKRFE